MFASPTPWTRAGRRESDDDPWRLNVGFGGSSSWFLAYRQGPQVAARPGDLQTKKEIEVLLRRLGTAGS